MIYLYRLFFFPILILLLPIYLPRMFKRGGYRRGFMQRFGLYPQLPRKSSKKRIWLQAVSVGEVQAILPLIDAFYAHGDIEIILTTTTSTAYEIALKNYSSKTLFIGFFPLDFWWFSHNAWKKFNPDLAIMMEGEVWPEHLKQAQIRNIPIILINARLSDRSYQRLLRFNWLVKGLYEIFSAIGVSNLQDGERIIQLMGLSYSRLGKKDAQQDVFRGEPSLQSEGNNGIHPRLVLTGNLKLDVVVKPMLTGDEKINLMLEMGFVEHNANLYLRRLDALPKVLLGSSTWPGEEALLIETLKKVLSAGVDCRLLLIPRHAERREEIIKLLSQHSITWHVRSKNKQALYPNYIYLADTMGEMTCLSQIADVAFIGKSLPPNQGGQTPIEAACLGIPMVMGPNMSNFRQVARSLIENKIAIQARDAAEVQQNLITLLKDTQIREGMSFALKSWHALNRGATKRTMELLEPYLK